MTDPGYGSACGVHDLTGTQRRWPAHLVRVWRGALAEASNAGSWETRPPWRGAPALRTALGELLGLENPLVTAGIRPLVAPFALLGRRVVVERPGFEGVALAFERCGVRVLRAGIDEALRRARPASEYLVWITSPWRNPDGWSLGAGETVERLGDFVRDGGVLVQNETYRLFVPGPVARTPTRLAGAYLAGSFTKAAGSWSRLGWLSAPAVPGPLEAHLRAAAPSTVWQEAWALFAAADGFDRLAERAAAVAELTAAMSESFGGSRVGGTSVLLRLGAADPVRLLREQFGLLAGDGVDFAAPPGTVRLCLLGCGPDCDHAGVEALLRSGIARV
jgi:DNA-binding transcriptional MocR family regulator